MTYIDDNIANDNILESSATTLLVIIAAGVGLVTLGVNLIQIILYYIFRDKTPSSCTLDPKLSAILKNIVKKDIEVSCMNNHDDSMYPECYTRGGRVIIYNKSFRKF